MMYDTTPRVTVTHKPTGKTVRVRVDRHLIRSMTQAREWAVRVLRSMLAAPESSADVIRRYDLGGPAGARITDVRTGIIVKGDDVARVLDYGEVERFREQEVNHAPR